MTILVTPGDNSREGFPKSSPLDPTCPRCGHIHKDGGECGMYMVGGRYCLCSEAVPA